MTIGERIKQRRIELGMSQEQLAHKLGYKSRSSVNKIELGGQNLTQPKIESIAKALDTTPDYIMGWDGSGKNDHRPLFRRGMYIQLTDNIEEFLKKANEERVNSLFNYMEYLLSQQEKEDNQS